jgi:hypothetical protein
MNIVVNAKGGLGNKMRVLASCIALSQRLRHEVTVLWVRNKELNCSYYDLFEPIDGIIIKEYNYIPRWNKLALRTRAKKLTDAYSSFDLQFADEEIKKLKGLKSDMVKLIINAHSVYIDTCQHFYGDESFLAYLKPVALLTAEIERRVAIISSNYVGVHIRRGDNQNAINVSKREIFIAMMKEQITQEADTKFFLATDDRQEVKVLKQVFGDRIIYFASGLKRNKPKHIAQALIDLMVLSKSKDIIGSYYSSFSDVAAAYGGINLRVAK